MARRLILTACVLALVGCAEPAPPTLAEGTLEAALPASIWPDDPALVGDVSCPDLDADLVAQATTCTATLDGDPVTVDVVVDEVGAATAGIREPLFVLADAAEELGTRLRDDLSIESIRVSCEGTVFVAEPGRPIACDATDDVRTISFALVLGHEGEDWTLRLAE